MENIDEYYRSLKKIYDYLTDRKEPVTVRRRVSRIFMWLAVASGLGVLFTLIPAIPVMLSIVLPRLGRGLSPVTLAGIYLDPSLQYWLLCLIGSLVGLTIFGLVYNWVEPAPSEPEYALSPDQVSFVLLYAAFEELRLYLIDNLTEHVDRARIAIEKLLPLPHFVVYGRLGGEIRLRSREAQLRELESSLEDLSADLVVLEEAHSPLATPAMASQLEITSEFLRTYERYHWFTMDEQTEATLRALTSFPSKIYTRLVAKQDLPRLKTVVEHLAHWVYAYLPEFEASRAPEELQALREAGDRELAYFTAEMEGLAEYEPPSPPLAEKRVRRPWIVRRMLTGERIEVRFFAWFVLLLIVTSALFFIAVQVFGVPREQAVLMIISNSVLGAAGLAVVPTVIKGERKT